ncbi:M15 family metallopeptidase [Cupriavidus nantongensis]|uniref:Peptidase M15 n=1 Tax=Cupriavidus nantongensis TaxID=1796606 RepID=A0A142JMZ2_9BURK|nr:M15 family metallopeptidase [Cupriavidus nantongensis]AMR79454.1 peptidase M15 [Cupriavidus nantongensis]
MKLTQRDVDRLKGVHPDLVKLVQAVSDMLLGPMTFMVIEGLRTAERQRELVKAGKSQTQNSRHLTGHAVDLGVLIDGKLTWDFKVYKTLADIVKAHAARLGAPIVWGGDWKTLKDGPHFELDRKVYP